MIVCDKAIIQQCVDHTVQERHSGTSNDGQDTRHALLRQSVVAQRGRWGFAKQVHSGLVEIDRKEKTATNVPYRSGLNGRGVEKSGRIYRADATVA